MSYYKILGLEEEPFSTSPDPDFFYESAGHKEALLRLEISLNLKRGLSLILGDVGTGKTTLARKLFATFSDKTKYYFSMILDPASRSELDFHVSVADAFEIKPEVLTVRGYKKAMERHLFQRGLDENKTVILLVDEAQKLNDSAIEVLRTLLNYETNKFKLLQLVLLGQTELLPQLKEINNFWERIALKYVINPLNEKEIKEMIEFRLRQAGYKHQMPLFNDDAISVIHDHTQGCPRRICHLCHDALEMLIIKNRPIVDRDVINELLSEEMSLVNVK